MGHLWAKKSLQDPIVMTVSEECPKDFSLCMTGIFDKSAVISARYGNFLKQYF
jgi:hypothetical protein